jgi:hypothetical protein
MRASKSILTGSLFVLAMLVAVPPLYAHGPGAGMMGPAYGGRPYYSPPWRQGWYGPQCGAYQGGGWGMGPYMMGPGWHHGMMGPGRRCGMMGPGWRCGMMGPGWRYGMMRPGWGYGMMGPGWRYGMMRPGWGYGYGYGPQYQPLQRQPVDEEQAKDLVEGYLKSTRNPNLKLGKIKDEGQYFEVEIVTNDNSLANMIIVNKDTGWMRSAY